jgi:hypothetical protein
MRYAPNYRPSALRTLGLYSLTYILEGEGLYDSAVCPARPVVAGDMMLGFPGVPDRWYPRRGTSWFEMHAVFGGAAFDQLAAAGIISPAQAVRHVDPIDYWRAKFERTLATAGPERDNQPAGDILRFAAFIADVWTGFEDENTVASADWLESAKSRLTQDMSHPMALPEVAEQLGMSYESFRKKFARAAGRRHRRIAGK